jgi:Zn-dependent peptidase ImmA (M78 family)
MAERRVNAFAIEFLMPEPVVRWHWQELRDSSEMAELFDVSRRIMLRRLAALDLLAQTGPVDSTDDH